MKFSRNQRMPTLSVDEFQTKIRMLAVGYPLSVTSWGRSRKRNAEVGGRPTSLHLSWVGLDGVLDSAGDIPAFTKRAEQAGIRVVNEMDTSSPHLHLQVYP